MCGQGHKNMLGLQPELALCNDMWRDFKHGANVEP